MSLTPEDRQRIYEEEKARIEVRAQVQAELGVGAKKRTTAAAYALLLGGVGAHKFYLDRPGQGIFYIIFCWTFIPMILGFLEGLTYLSMSDKSFQQAYGPRG